MRIVVCQWLDAKVSVDGDIPDLPLMTSVGYLYSRDKYKTVIVSLTGTDGDPRIIQTIPACLVKKIEALTMKKKE